MVLQRVQEPPRPLPLRTQVVTSLAALRTSRQRVNPHYLDGVQPVGCFQLCHREKIVDYVFNIAADFHCSHECAWLSVICFDRYAASCLSRGVPIPKAQLDGLACACFLIAAKFLEPAVPSFPELAADLNCKVHDLMQLELGVLGELGWDVHTATPHSVVGLLMPEFGFRHDDEATRTRVLELALALVDIRWRAHRSKAPRP
jgi:hypothetical protein